MDKIGLKSILDKIIRVLSYICMVILFIACLFLVFYIISNIIARKKGEYPLVSMYTIVSPSMEPNIMVYDIIFDTRISKEEELKVGDIITFYSTALDTKGYTVTHRIKEINVIDGQTFFITKGDNNDLEDEGFITREDIVGKVLFVIPKVGRIQAFISSRLGWLCIIMLPAISIIVTDILKLKKIYNIKHEIEEIPQLKEVTKIREQEDDKKIRALIEKADRFNKK